MSKKNTSNVSVLSFPIYVITHGTKDFGVLFVVREHRVRADDKVIAAAQPLTVANTLEQARAAIATKTYARRCVRRADEEDIVIVEWWV